jgi:hypothetical protein
MIDGYAAIRQIAKRKGPLGVYGWFAHISGGQSDRNPAEGRLNRW